MAFYSSISISVSSFLGNRLITKWRNIKDTYVRSIKKKTRLGQAPDKGRRYIYARQLSFLHQAGAETSSSSADRNPESDSLYEEATESVDAELDFGHSLYQQHSSKKYKFDLNLSNKNNLENTIPPSHIYIEPQSNPEKYFLDSLIPFVTNFTEDQKLQFRCEVLQLIQQIRRGDTEREIYLYTQKQSPYSHLSPSSSASFSTFTETKPDPEDYLETCNQNLR